MGTVEKVSSKLKFNINDLVMCPVHGVGKFTHIIRESVFDTVVSFYIIEIVSKDLTLRIPCDKIEDSGIRPINDKSIIDVVLEYLSSSYVKKEKIIWNKKHLQYEEKFNSTNLLDILSIVKELYCTKNKADENLMTFSEKNIYNLALQKAAQEIAAITDSSIENAIEIIIRALADN